MVASSDPSEGKLMLLSKSRVEWCLCVYNLLRDPAHVIGRIRNVYHKPDHSAARVPAWSFSVVCGPTGVKPACAPVLQPSSAIGASSGLWGVLSQTCTIHPVARKLYTHINVRSGCWPPKFSAGSLCVRRAPPAICSERMPPTAEQEKAWKADLVLRSFVG